MRTTDHPPSTRSLRRIGAPAVALAVLAGVVLSIGLPAAALETHDGFTTDGRALAEVVRRGGTIRLEVDVTATATRQALVDVEVHTSAGEKVFQQFFDDEPFISGVPRTFAVDWSVPADQRAGRYRVNIGIFDVDWAGLAHWNEYADTFWVTARGTPPSTSTTTTVATSTSTTTSTPTTTPPTSATSTTPATTSTSTTTSTTTPSVTTTSTSTPTTAPPATTAPAPSGGQFTASFESAADLDRFDWQVMHGGVDPFPRSDQPKSWHGDHDMSCGVPTTLRDVHLQAEAGPGPLSVTGDNVWFCAPGDDPAKGHIMTSMTAVGYAHVDFSPRQTFNNVGRICWDQNQTEVGGRKWTQVSVIPDGLFRQNGGRLDYVAPDSQDDVAVGGVRLQGDAFLFMMLRASTQVRAGQSFEWNDFGGFNTTDKARRFRQCLVDQGGSVRIELEQPNGTDVRTVPGVSLPDGPVRVIFQDVTYDSVKGDMPMNEALQTNTWHWDNIAVS